MFKPGFQGCRGRGGARTILVALILWLTALTLAGCASTGPAPVDGWDGRGSVPKGYYLVRKDDTLSVIAARRRVSVEKLIRWNALKPPYTVYAGKLLRVAPVGGRGGSPRVATSRPKAKGGSARGPTGACRDAGLRPRQTLPGIFRGSGADGPWRARYRLRRDLGLAAGRGHPPGLPRR